MLFQRLDRRFSSLALLVVPGLLSSQPTRIKRDEVLDWFDGSPNVELAHREIISEHPLIPEDFD